MRNRESPGDRDTVSRHGVTAERLGIVVAKRALIPAGNLADHFWDQCACEAKVTDYLGPDPEYNIGVKAGGSTGGSTVITAAMAVLSGQASVALAVAWECMSEVDTRKGN